MKIYKLANIEATYIGNCKNSFNSNGNSNIDCFVDVSDFALKDENAIELDKDEFETFVKTIPSEVANNIRGHILKYLFYDGNIYVIYDTDEDIHYFFR